MKKDAPTSNVSSIHFTSRAKDDYWLAHFASLGALNPHSALLNCAGAITERRLGGGILALLGAGLVFATANGCAMGILLAIMP